MDLTEVRKEINAIDAELRQLLGRRLECSGQVARVKLETGDKVYKPLREKEIREEFLAEGDRYGLSEVKNIVMNSRKYQYGIFLDEGKQSEAFNIFFDDEKKSICEQGGSIRISVRVDETGERGLCAGDVLLAVADSEVDIISMEQKKDILSMEIYVENTDMAKRDAYILFYMLSEETIS